MRTARIHAASWLAVLTVISLGGDNVVGGTTVTAVATDPLLAGDKESRPMGSTFT